MGGSIKYLSSNKKPVEITVRETVITVWTRWMLLTPIGIIMGFSGLFLALMFYVDSISDLRLTLCEIGFILCFPIFIIGVIYGEKTIPIYKISSKYGERIIIKTNPANDQRELCKAKSEIESQITELQNKIENENKRIQDLIDNCK